MSSIALNAVTTTVHAADAHSCVIRVRELSKCYRLYAKPEDRLKELLWFGRRRFHREHWVLNRVSLEVNRGETVGIVGRNGSGKSTLLQIICGTLSPNSGQVEVNGRISALLELGMGFNPEFSGRENVYVNAALLGLSERETAARFDEIVDFAELHDAIDQPVKTYSSGMFVRLAFAVATSVDPDILVVDEALSVGDEAFQRKCFSRIEQLKQRGATILFVSHSATTVLELCDRAVLLDEGELLLNAGPKQVISKYHRLLYCPPERLPLMREELRRLGDGDPASAKPGSSTVRLPDQAPSAFFDPGLVSKSTIAYASRGARIDDCRIRDETGAVVNILVQGRDYELIYGIGFTQTAFSVRSGMMIKTVSGLELGGGTTSPLGHGLEAVSPGDILYARFRFTCRLCPGTYFMNVGVSGLVDGAEVYLDRRVDALMFRVYGDPNPQMTGVVDFGVVPVLEHTPGEGQPV